MLQSQVLGLRTSTQHFGAHTTNPQGTFPLAYPPSLSPRVSCYLFALGLYLTSVTALTTLGASATCTYTPQPVRSPGEQRPPSFPFSILMLALLGTVPGAQYSGPMNEYNSLQFVSGLSPAPWHFPYRYATMSD